MCSPVISSNIIYGTSYYDGSQNDGMVFKVNTDTTGFEVLKDFAGSDGSMPIGGLVISSNTLYGTTQTGGAQHAGTIFKVNMDGSDFKVLKDFSSAMYGDGRFPYASLILSGSTLYGTTSQGGSTGQGTVFRIDTDGNNYTILKSFLGSDGAYPKANLVLSNSVLFGTTAQGGSNSAANGTVFKIDLFDNSFSVLANLGGTNGQLIYSPVTVVGNTVYGTAGQGGDFDYGTIFKVNTDGSGFTVLKSFGNTNGAFPTGGLTAVSNVLYGTAQYGGSAGYGTIFKINSDGNGFEVVRHMSLGDGAYPYGTLTLSSNTLYGTTQIGGSGGVNDGGTVFALTLTDLPMTANQISAQATANGKIQLDYLGSPGTNYILDQTYSLASPVTWLPVSTNAADVNGNLHFTNAITQTNTFWRIRLKL